MSIIRRVHVVAVATTLVVVGTVAQAATQAQIDTARNKGLAWLISHQKADGSWKDADGTEVVSTSTALDALRASSVIKSYPYAKGVSWLANSDAASTDSLARKTLTLYYAGVNVRPAIDQLVSWRTNVIGSSGSTEVKNTAALWGAYKGYGASLPDTPLALKTLRTINTYYIYGPDSDATPSQNHLLYNAAGCYLLPMQRADGSWPSDISYHASIAVTMPNVLASTGSAILAAAYTALELNAIKAFFAADVFGCGTLGYSVATSTTYAINWLVAQKKADNGFGTQGVSTVFETAVAYEALNTLAPANTATAPSLDYLISKQAADGSWEASASETALIVKNLPAPTALPDTDGDGVPDAIETILGYSPSVSDSRWLAN